MPEPRSRRPHRISRPPKHEAATVQTVIDALRRIVQVLRASAGAAEHVGLTGAQMFVLRQLGATPRISMNELAARTFTHQSTVSLVVARLVSRRLVVKVAAAEDRRRVELTLTPAGRNILRRAPEAAQERLVRAILNLRSRDRAVLARALTSVADGMGVPVGRVPMLFEDQDRRPG